MIGQSQYLPRRLGKLSRYLCNIWNNSLLGSCGIQGCKIAVAQGRSLLHSVLSTLSVVRCFAHCGNGDSYRDTCILERLLRAGGARQCVTLLRGSASARSWEVKSGL